MEIFRRLMPRLSALFCVVLLILLLIDRIWPSIYLFDGEVVKLFVLIACLSAGVTGVLLSMRQREQTRRNRRR